MKKIRALLISALLKVVLVNMTLINILKLCCQQLFRHAALVPQPSKNLTNMSAVGFFSVSTLSEDIAGSSLAQHTLTDPSHFYCVCSDFSQTVA